VIPRWFGDANFITVVGKTRVLPESLEESYNKIVETWNSI
jgi:ATP adenylyltransferase